MSNRQLAKKYGISPTAINNRIAREGWTADGPDYDQIVTDDTELLTLNLPDGKGVVKKKDTAEHLRKRAKDLAQRLLAEIEDVTTYESEIAEIIVKEETDPIRRRAALKAISTGERIKNLKEITAIIDAVDPKRKIAKTAKTAEAAADKPQGKKAEQQAEAEKIAAGRFAPRSGPPRLVANG